MGFEVFRDLTLTVVIVVFIASLGSTSFGYDNGWWSSILGSPYFNEKYGTMPVVNAETGAVTYSLTSTQQSCGTGLSTAGLMMGCLIAPFINQRYGRKFCMYTMGVGSIVGTAVQLASTANLNFWVLVVGKLVLNTSVGISAGSIGTYVAECAPASCRGLLLNMYAFCQTLGSMTATGAVFGVVDRTDYLNWILPIGLQAVIPIVVLVFAPFLPESPRFLIMKGRDAEASDALHRLRKGSSEAQIVAESVEIKTAHDAHAALASGHGWLDLFTGSNLRRTLICVGIMCLQQAQGVGFIANYLVVLLLDLGIPNPYTIVLVVSAVMIVASFIALFLPDWLGRRTLLVGGAILETVGMGIVAIISTINPVPTGPLANALIFAIFLWVIAFGCTWSSLVWVIAGELPSVAMREKTLGVGAASGFAVGLIISFVTPYIQNAEYGNLGGKIAYLWMFFSAMSALFAWFCVPELRNKSLEALDLMWERGVPLRDFKDFDVTTLDLRGNLADDLDLDGKTDFQLSAKFDASKVDVPAHIELRKDAGNGA